MQRVSSKEGDEQEPMEAPNISPTAFKKLLAAARQQNMTIEQLIHTHFGDSDEPATDDIRGSGPSLLAAGQSMPDPERGDPHTVDHIREILDTEFPDYIKRGFQINDNHDVPG